MAHRRKRSNSPIENLEPRLTPSTFGTAWPDAMGLTLSFAPDGTDVLNQPSRLESTLSQSMSTADWKREILRAFQTWAKEANVNIGVMADQGDAFGASSVFQGSTREGDLRVGARPLASSELAVSTPFDMFGVLSGDVIVNSGYTFKKGGTDGAYDLYTVMLQEAGHALGLANNPNTSSVMFTRYQSVRNGLSSEDIAAIRSLYGQRAPDLLEGKDGNDRFDRAATLKFVQSEGNLKKANPTKGLEPFVAAGDIGTNTDVDVYKLQLPPKSTQFSVYLRTSQVSLLQAKVSLFDDKQRLVQSVAATDPLSGDLVINVTGAREKATYFVRVEPNTDSVFGVGSYRLAVSQTLDLAREATLPRAFLAENNDAGDDGDNASQYNYVQFVNQDTGADDNDRAKGTVLGDAKPSRDSRWDFSTEASIHSSSDTDYFRVKPKRDSGTVMVATASAWRDSKLTPLVRVYDDKGIQIPVEVLSAKKGLFSIQFANAISDKDYFVRVSAADNLGDNSTGNYKLSIDFRDDMESMSQAASGVLTSAVKEQAYEMTLDRSQLYHFAVATSTSNANVKAAVRMTVYDQYGKVVASTSRRAGEVLTLDLFLDQGTYTVKFSGRAENSTKTMPNLTYAWKYVLRNDPIGPRMQNPTLPPPTTPPPLRIVVITPPPPDPYSDPYNPV